jgi:F-type H+-transporting ATPase subunit a
MNSQLLSSLRRWLLLVLLCAASVLGASAAHAQESAKPEKSDKTVAVANPAAEAVAAEEEHGLPQISPVLWHIGPLPVNSSMILMWAVAILIIAFAQYATRQIKEVPDGAQNVWEFLVEGLRNFLEGIIGRQLTRKTFWFFASIFIFILITNWFGLIPGVGTIGWGPVDANGHVSTITTPLLRGVNADLNMTSAMASIFFVCWVIWAIQSNGVGGFLMHIFGPKGETKGWLMGPLLVIIFFIVGCLEVISIAVRPISLSFRLYGNIFAGENMLDAMSHLVPALAPVIPIPFYFMELLVGVVQALVFMLLTAVFTLLICAHGEEPHGDHH